VIGLFAKLIGLGDLAKRVQKIFKKIRKRVDKVVRDLFKKAKKAGRKLMRKLGIGKKKKSGGKEERSKKEMEADLKMGISEGTKYVKSAEGKDKETIDKKLKQIAGKYDLKKLSLVVDKKNEDGKEQVHVHGEVNPTKNSDIFKVELDGENGDSITRPPAGRAYLVKQSLPTGPHYVAFFPNGNLYHLGYHVKTEEIYIKPTRKDSIKAVGAVSVPAEGTTVNDFTDDIEKKVKRKIDKYTGQGYKITENDCLVFTLEVLNSVFNSGVTVPRKKGKGKKAEPAENYDTWYDGFKKK
jgi:hypothetical protein